SFPPPDGKRVRLCPAASTSPCARVAPGQVDDRAPQPSRNEKAAQPCDLSSWRCVSDRPARRSTRATRPPATRAAAQPSASGGVLKTYVGASARRARRPQPRRPKDSSAADVAGGSRERQPQRRPSRAYEKVREAREERGRRSQARPRRPPQRLENWKRFLAPGCPYFFLSTTRASRVRKPAFFSCWRSSGSS